VPGAALGVLGFGIGRYWSAVTLAASALLSAVGHVFIIVMQRRRRARERQTKHLGTDARVRIIETAPRRVRIGTTVCLVVALLLVPVCLLPVLLIEAFQWPVLKSSDPEVVSPGDTMKLRIDGAPVQGVYRIANAKATVKNADELGGLKGPPELTIVPLTELVGSTTVEKNNDKARTRYEVQLEIPNNPGWAGATARVFVQLRYENVDKQGFFSYGEPVSIPLAPVGAGPMYRTSWWIAFLGGGVPAVLLGLALARLARISGAKPPAPGPAAAAPKPTA
jgi:hypothetical protein